MKKKILALILAGMLSISATACSSSETPETDETAETTEETEEETTEEDSEAALEAISDVEVEENLFTVELTIPAEYMEDATQEELDALAEENGYKSITLNEDGSATYIMTKKQHKEMMEGLSAQLNQALADMVGSDDYPNFTNVEVNSDFTEFTITTTSTELDLNESFSVLTFYMTGGMYHVFNGTTVDNIHVDYVNADSGEIISSGDSSDLAEAE